MIDKINDNTKHFIKYKSLNAKVIEYMIEMKDNQLISILKNGDCNTQALVIVCINKTFNTIKDRYDFLESIDKLNEFNKKDWFYLGVALSKQLE